jgi:DNA-binding LytR/AlgR family response regulator
MFLLLANLFYLVSYLLYNRKTEVITIREEVLVTPTPPFASITVQKGFTEMKIPINNCAVIESRNKFLWLHTYQGESFRLPGTLEEWEERLAPANFYRINRQFLVAAAAITSVEQTSTRKLKVNLVLPANDVYVSKLNAASFRQWWKNGRPS